MIDSIENFIKSNSLNNIENIGEIYLKVVDNLNYHNFLYYIKSDPIISDYEYDLLFDYLKKIEDQYPEFISPESPTQRLNNQIQSEFQKADHRFPLLSLENTYSSNEVEEFIDRLYRNYQITDFFVEPKYDGLSVEIIYENGYFKQAITRGNGSVGEDVTENVKTIRSLPLKINFNETLHVRGEVIIKKSIFEKVNEYQQEHNLQIYSNSRNLASGSLRQLDSSITKKRKLDILVYDILNFQELGFKKHTEILDFLENNNFFVFDILNLGQNFIKKRKSLAKEEVLDIVNSTKIKNLLDEQDIDFDGLVIKVNNTKDYENIGYTIHHPKRAFSFKYPPKQFTSSLLDVIFSVGRTGTITPVAVLDPINISGVTVKRASLHNFDFIKDKGIKIGDYVLIQRSGEVIPYIVSVLKEKRPNNFKEIEEPTKCPVCGGETFRPKQEVALKCINVTCPAQTKEKISYFVSKNGLDIGGLGGKTIDIFYDIGILKDYGDIFFIPDYKQKLLTLPGFQTKKIENLISSIIDRQSLNLDVFLTALGIEFVGKKTAKIIIEFLIDNNIIKSEGKINFLDIQLFFENPSSEEPLLLAHGLGPQTIQSIIKFFQEDHNKKVIEKILKKVKLFVKKDKKNGKFDGYIFCITGNIPQINRNTIIEFLQKNDGDFSNQITKQTTILLVGENPGNSKLDKSKELSVECKSLYTFLKNNGFKFPQQTTIQESLF